MGSMAATAGQQARERFAVEGFDERGAAPAAYEALFERWDEVALRAEAERVGAELREAGVSFGGGELAHDVIPRIVIAAEWDGLAPASSSGSGR